ncbi:beta-barrel assembly-enhancing protease [Candidatus Rariloculus sp.]|uniref:beta-barrel assembly-enhancing protease n=1 Tax=Candidatus Rariloculus sp. TaxID=3101265 RepID=UPI003D0EB8FF
MRSHLSKHAMTWGPKIVACLCAALSWHSACVAQSRELPDFGSPADTILNRSKEAQLGRSVMLQLRSAGAIVEDPQLTEYIRILGSRLASQANNGDFDFNFFVIDDQRINAFAMPGGHIGVHTGLISASENESELAGVLAHEVSHVTQRHIARSIYDNQRMSIVSIATMLAAILIGAATDSTEATQGLLMGSQAAQLQRQINFTRSNEHEADRIGMGVLAAAGFDPNGMASFFEKLSIRYGAARQNVPQMLQTHPVTGSRIAEARGRARQLPQREHIDSRGYSLAKARIMVLNAATPDVALAQFDELDDDSPAKRYGRALALSRMTLSDDAERLFRSLVTDFPTVITYRIGHAEALMASGYTELAMEVYEEASELFPRNVPLTISYAEALIDTRQPAKAHSFLLDLLNNVPPTPAQIQLIARAANAEGDVGNAQYYMGEYWLSVGNLPLAIDQIRMALEAPGVDIVDKARFEAKLELWTSFLPEDDRRRGPRRGRGDEAGGRSRG